MVPEQKLSLEISIHFDTSTHTQVACKENFLGWAHLACAGGDAFWWHVRKPMQQKGIGNINKRY